MPYWLSWHQRASIPIQRSSNVYLSALVLTAWTLRDTKMINIQIILNFSQQKCTRFFFLSVWIYEQPVKCALQLLEDLLWTDISGKGGFALYRFLSAFFFFLLLLVSLARKEVFVTPDMSLPWPAGSQTRGKQQKQTWTFLKKKKASPRFARQKWWRLRKCDDSDGQTCQPGLRKRHLGCRVGVREAKLKIQAWVRKTSRRGVPSHQRTEGQQRERCRRHEWGKRGDFL